MYPYSEPIFEITKLLKGIEVEDILPPTVSRPVSLVIDHLPEAHDQISITVGHFVIFFSCGAPSLTRGRVCNLFLQLLLSLPSAVTLGFTSR
jgi:hypothetical protein